MGTPVVQKDELPGVIRATSSLLMIAGSVGMAAMMLHICIDVFSRFLFGAHIVGTLEYVTYFYMVVVVFLPLGRVQEERGHVFVEVISQLFTQRANVWIDRFAQCFTFVYTAFIGYWGWQETMRSFTRIEVVTILQSDLPLWPTRLLVPVGLAAMCVVILAQLAQSFRSGRLPPRETVTH